MGGVDAARTGIKRISGIIGYSREDWRGSAAYYRKFLFMQAEPHQKKGMKIDKERIREVLAAGGKLSMAELLSCRVRYLSDGAVFGSREFVEGVFVKYRDEFGAKRKSGARKMRYGECGGLCTMRDLRREPVTISSG
jgi:hypothetical protein